MNLITKLVFYRLEKLNSEIHVQEECLRHDLKEFLFLPKNSNEAVCVIKPIIAYRTAKLKKLRYKYDKISSKYENCRAFAKR